MTTTLNIKNIAIAAVLSLGTIGSFASGAQAMTLHNCTGWTLPVDLQDNTGSVRRAGTIAPQNSQTIHATNSYGPYRIILPTLGAGAHFSNRSGDGTFSLIQTSGGNIGIRNGNVCPQAPVAPTNSGGNAGQVCFKNDFGFEVCLRP